MGRVPTVGSMDAAVERTRMYLPRVGTHPTGLAAGGFERLKLADASMRARRVTPEAIDLVIR